MIEYIPDPDQEEETLITAKIDGAIERLRKRMDERVIKYIDKETNIDTEIQVESPLMS